MTRPPADGTGVTLVSAVRLRPGVADAHRRLHEAAVASARRLGGLVSDELVPAMPGVQPETVALLRFGDRAALDRWLCAEDRRTALEAMARLADGDRTVTVLGGFAGWFPAGAHALRWKQAVVVLAALIPVALATAALRSAVLPSLPLLPAVAFTSASNVAALTWVVMPTLTRRLERWLGH
jgi:antibiotic biosynthesis monooxygenase (ABM) superfamily enzyme